MGISQIYRKAINSGTKISLLIPDGEQVEQIINELKSTVPETREVHIFNLVAHDTREGKVLKLLFDKLNEMSSNKLDVIGKVFYGKNLSQKVYTISILNIYCAKIIFT